MARVIFLPCLLKILKPLSGNALIINSKPYLEESASNTVSRKLKVKSQKSCIKILQAQNFDATVILGNYFTSKP